MTERLSGYGRVRQYRTFSWAMLILPTLAAGCSYVPPGVSIGKRAPELSGSDPTGRTIKLSDYKGKVVLLDFWGTWCPPCVESIPAERELMRLYGKRPFTILGVCRDDPHALQAFLAKEPLPWPNLVDASGSVVKAWGIEGFPSWVLINDEGMIQGRWTGGQDVAQVEEAVAHAVQIAETR